MTNIVLTEKEKKALKECEEYEKQFRIFREKYDGVIDDILREIATLSPAGFSRSSELGDLLFMPKKK